MGVFVVFTFYQQIQPKMCGYISLSDLLFYWRDLLFFKKNIVYYQIVYMQQPVDVLAKCLECIKHEFCVDLKEYDFFKGKNKQTFKWIFNEFGANLSLKNLACWCFNGGYFFLY